METQTTPILATASEGFEIHRNHAVCPGVGICSSSVYWEDATKGSYVMNIP